MHDFVSGSNSNFEGGLRSFKNGGLHVQNVQRPRWLFHHVSGIAALPHGVSTCRVGDPRPKRSVTIPNHDG